MPKLHSIVELTKRHLQLVRHPSNAQFVPRWIFTLITKENPLESAVPWIPFTAIDFLTGRINTQSQAFEYGGGGSTLWLARRLGHLTTVEHDPAWYEMIRDRLLSDPSLNVDLRLVQPDSSCNDQAYSSDLLRGSFKDYVSEIDQLPEQSLDFVLIDGRARMSCLRHSVSKVAPGGMLMLDDTYRPQYDDAKEILKEWELREFVGLRPNSLWPSVTSCWIRPS